MNIEMTDKYYPGSVISKESIGVPGDEFLDKIFFLSSGIMLTQIREVSGVDGSTLQNWVKRGWIGNTVNKKYSKNQLARILIINMLRGAIKLEKIDFLLKYINGTINCEDDDIIPEAELYGYICRITDSFTADETVTQRILKEHISRAVSDYTEKMPGARARLENALAVIITAYSASILKSQAYDNLSMLEK